MPNGAPEVIDLLQQSLVAHWSQAEAYDTQAEHLTRIGFPALGSKWAEYALEERGHIKKLIARLEFFGEMPEREHGVTPWPRDNFPGILDSNYEGDLSASQIERSGYTTAMELGDPGSSQLFAELLAGSLESMANIEALRFVIDTVTLPNFLANQTSPPEQEEGG